MAFTTLAALSSNLYGLTVSGVKTKSQYRPRTVNAGQLVLSYARLPTRQNGLSTLSYAQGLKRATIEWVFLVEFLELNTLTANDAKVVTLMDAIASTLESNAALLGMDDYSIAPDEDTLDDGARAIQAVIATIEVSG